MTFSSFFSSLYLQDAGLPVSLECMRIWTVFEKLGKNSEFKKVYKFGKSKANRYLVMILVERESGPNRYGFSVSKKVGNSVVRHRITRLLRESVRTNDAKLKKSYNVVIVARNTAKGRSFQEIESAFLHLCRLHGIM